MLSLQKPESVLSLDCPDPVTPLLTSPHPEAPPTALSTGGEAAGAGEAGLPQHTQEAHGMSAGPARGGGRQALGKCPPSPGGCETRLLTDQAVSENCLVVWQCLAPRRAL